MISKQSHQCPRATFRPAHKSRREPPCSSRRGSPQVRRRRRRLPRRLVPEMIRCRRVSPLPPRFTAAATTTKTTTILMTLKTAAASGGTTRRPSTIRCRRLGILARCRRSVPHRQHPRRNVARVGWFGRPTPPPLRLRPRLTRAAARWADSPHRSGGCDGSVPPRSASRASQTRSLLAAVARRDRNPWRPPKPPPRRPSSRHRGGAVRLVTRGRPGVIVGARVRESARVEPSPLRPSRGKRRCEPGSPTSMPP